MKKIYHQLIVLNISTITFIFLFQLFYKTEKQLGQHFHVPLLFNDEVTKDDNYWTRISDDVFVYSAYWEDRVTLSAGVPFLRVVSIVRLRGHKFNITSSYLGKEYKSTDYDIQCHLWFEKKIGNRIVTENITTGNVTVSVFEEGLKKYASAYVLCYLNETYGRNVFHSVSISPKKHNYYPAKLIPIRYRRLNNTADAVGICARALYGPYDDINQVAQFLSYYSLMGVSEFTFYNLAVTPHVERYLLQVKNHPNVKVNILPWNLPTGNWSDLWDYGALAALNDCMYRSQSNIILAVDLDEYIMLKDGKQFKNFTLMWKHLQTTRKTIQEPVGFSFRNVFFCKEYKRKRMCNKTRNSYKEHESEFEMFRTFHREERTWSSRLRSKLMFLPEYVVSLGHHSINQFAIPATGISVASFHIAILRHYRHCNDITHGNNNKGSGVLTSSVICDNTALEYIDRIMNSTFVKILRNVRNSIHLPTSS